jgi:hypothetical protein
MLTRMVEVDESVLAGKLRITVLRTIGKKVRLGFEIATEAKPSDIIEIAADATAKDLTFIAPRK